MNETSDFPATSAGALTIERVTDPSRTDVDDFARLLPGLSKVSPPDHATLLAIAAAPGTSLLVARLDRRMVGALTLVVFRIPTGLRALVEDVVVDEQVRGRGIGAALVAEALRLAGDAGARSVELTSRPAREAANRLYARSGFIRRETNVWRYSFD